jgi:DNA repair protein RadC
MTAVASHERLEVMGFEHGSDAELLAIVLGGRDALARAQALLHAFGGLLAVQRASAPALRRVPGVGKAGAAAVHAAFELARRAGRMIGIYVLDHVVVTRKGYCSLAALGLMETHLAH